MSVINTNVMSLNSQRNLATNSSSLATSIQRLSSGLRINSAKDDAAGLAISERFSTQIRGMNQASRNANDGISLAQTAEGALGEIGNNLQRVRELAVQSRNATNSADDRAALQKEVGQLKAEIQRVAEQTSFNGTNLLDGSFTAQAFQVGANQGQTITVDSIANANIDSLGSWTSAAATATTSVASGAYTQAASTTSTDAFQLSIGGVVVSDRLVGDASAANIDTDVNTFIAASNGAYTRTGSVADGNLVISKTDGTSMAIATSFSDGIGSSATAAGTTSAGTFAGAGFVGSHANGVAAGTAMTGFDNLDISTVGGADNAILAMDAALNSVNNARADLGAVQNRFQSVVSNLNTTSENLSASRSRIRDTDYAKETAELSRTQILSQAGTAMLAQANQATQGVLSLLR